MNFNVGDKVRFKSFEKISITRSAKIGNYYGIGDFYLKIIVSSKKEFIINEISYDKINNVKSIMLFNEVYYFPLEWFEPPLDKKINKIIKL